jgi:hypothetical protein
MPYVERRLTIQKDCSCRSVVAVELDPKPSSIVQHVDTGRSIPDRRTIRPTGTGTLRSVSPWRTCVRAYRLSMLVRRVVALSAVLVGSTLHKYADDDDDRN